MNEQLLTIGALANRVGLRTSALRYYENQGLLQPDGRTAAGYRLYKPTAEQTLRLIQRAQRLGLSLADIRQLLTGYHSDSLSDKAILEIVEARAVALEKQLTDLLVLQHELDLFLQDMRHEPEDTAVHTGNDHFDQLLQRICLNPHPQTARNWLDWLITAAGCRLNSPPAQAILRRLEGQHIHVWQEEAGYHILIVSDEAQVVTAVSNLAELEDDCHAPTHADLTTYIYQDIEGIHFTIQGSSAFIYARLFLALEQAR
ncbi:MAG: MerR family transcriptional regulator [Chloroflexi bacterium]|nr:MerR family transcriptional regulator [Chloroflexota bacterium]